MSNGGDFILYTVICPILQKYVYEVKKLSSEITNLRNPYLSKPVQKQQRNAYFSNLRHTMLMPR